MDTHTDTARRHDEVPAYVLTDLYDDPATRIRFHKGTGRYNVTAENVEHGPIRLGWVCRTASNEWSAYYTAAGSLTGRVIAVGRTRSEAADELLPTARRLAR